MQDPGLSSLQTIDPINVLHLEKRKIIGSKLEIIIFFSELKTNIGYMLQLLYLKDITFIGQKASLSTIFLFSYFRAFSNIFSNRLTALCQVYIIIRINVGPRISRGCSQQPQFRLGSGPVLFLLYRCIYDLEVPSNNKVLIKVLALEIDCPYDYIQFMTDIQPNVITLCPTWSALPGINFTLTLTSLENFDRPENWVIRPNRDD